MKTLVLTGSSMEMHAVLDATIPSKWEYCMEKGYDLKIIKLGYQHPIFGDRMSYERVVETFKQVGEYDAVMWLDADAFITNMNYDIKDFQYEDKPISASLDWTDCTTINMGNFVIYKTNKVKDLYEEFVQLGSKMFLDHPEREQKTINFILDSNPEMVHVLPRNYLNGVPKILEKFRVGEEREIVEPWNENCFLAHLTAILYEDRIKIIKKNLLNIKKRH